MTHAPYAFVPLSAWVYQPEWADRVSHDRPMPDGWSGTIEIDIKAITPLLIGAERRKPDENGPTTVLPFVLPDGRAAIPGSSLRGMLRNIIQIAAFGQIGPWTDAKHERTIDYTRSRKSSASDHLSEAVIDLATLIFGAVNDNENSEQKGRVSFTAAVSDTVVKTDELGSYTTVLGEPKSSFYPHYIRQAPPSSGGSLAPLAQYKPDRSAESPEARWPEISGWKRYPARETWKIDKPPHKAGPKVQTILEPIPAVNLTFSGQIYIHNMNSIELGALLWALSWGNRDVCRHRIGMGKPYGLGEIDVSISRLFLEPNDLAQDAIEQASREKIRESAAQFIDTFCREMNAAYSKFSDVPPSNQNRPWEKSEQILTLLAMADAELGAKQNLRYLPFKDHNKAKKSHDGLPAYPISGEDQPIRDHAVWPRSIPEKQQGSNASGRNARNDGQRNRYGRGQRGGGGSPGTHRGPAGWRKGQKVMEIQEGLPVTVAKDAPADATEVWVIYEDSPEPEKVPVSYLKR